MRDWSRFRPEQFSIKRVLLLVAIIESVLAAVLFAYWYRYQRVFFPYPMEPDGSVVVDGTTLVIGYGARVPAPWRFTNVGGDTLLLDGLPFEPMRTPDVAEDLPAPQRDRLQTIKELLAEAEAAYQQGRDKRDGMRRFAAALHRYDGTLVVSVELDEKHKLLTVDFVDDLPPITVSFLHDPRWIEPENYRRARHYDAMKTFIDWTSANPDGVFCFGKRQISLIAGRDAQLEFNRLLDTLRDLQARATRPLTIDDVRQALGDDELLDRQLGLVKDFIEYQDRPRRASR